MDLVPIVAIVAGNIMIVAVVATVAAAITKGRKYKLALREQERKPSGADAAIDTKTSLAKTDNLSRRFINESLTLPAKQVQLVAGKTEYMTVKQSSHAQQILHAFTSINRPRHKAWDLLPVGADSDTNRSSGKQAGPTPSQFHLDRLPMKRQV